MLGTTMSGGDAGVQGPATRTHLRQDRPTRADQPGLPGVREKDGPKPLHVRVWTCRGCGTVLDRDINAAVNVAKAAGLAASACGAHVSPGSALAQRDEAGILRGAASAGTAGISRIQAGEEVKGSERIPGSYA